MSAERVAEVLRPFTDIAAALEQGAPDSPLARDVAADLRAGVERAAALLAEPTDQDQRETRTEWALRWSDGYITSSTPHEQVVRRAQRDDYPDTTVLRREVGPWVEVPS